MACLHTVARPRRSPLANAYVGFLISLLVLPHRDV